jgi:hypothetical protein
LDSLLLAPVQVAQPHAIPFRTIFEEHLRRRQPEFMAALTAMFPPAVASGDSVTQLEAEISRQEAAYRALASAYEQIQNGRLTGPDQELRRCANSERKLKELLHLTDASALCLSGGGIRSASFCLGILEGLARISRNPNLNPPAPAGARPDGLLDRLDYLSTVSGGGYIGSWLMSWTCRRMAASRSCPTVADALDRALDCIERAQAVHLEIQTRVSPALPAAGSNEEDALKDRLWSLALVIKKGCENAQTAANRAAKIPATDPSCGAYGTAANTALTELTNANLFAKERTGTTILKRAALANDLTVILTHLTAAAAAMRVTLPSWRNSYGEVVDALADTSNSSTSTSFVTGGDPEPQPVRHLRSYTSFLAPELGATLDTSTLVAIVLRNLVVNWAMLVPVLFAAVSLARSSSFLLEELHHYFAAHQASWGSLIATITLVLLVLLAALTAAASLPSHYAVTWLDAFRRSPQKLFVTPIFVVCWLLTAFGATTFVGTFWIALTVFVLIGGSIFLSYKDRVTGRMLSWGRGTETVISVILVTAVASAAVTTALLKMLEKNLFPWLLAHTVKLPGATTSDKEAAQWLFVVFALPLVTLTLMTSCSLFCAVLGIYEMEEDREWWVRAGGWLLALDVVWIFGHGLALYGLGLQQAIWTGVVGLVVGAAGSFAGFSGSTSAGPRPVKAAQLTKVGKFLTKHNLLLPAIGLLAVILIGIGVVALEETVRAAIYDVWPYQPKWLAGNWSVSTQNDGVLGLESALAVLIAFGLLAIVMNWAININLFSLQGMYRMRLMRAFLGASNTFRRENPFTHFDPKDTPYETDLPSAFGAPLHVINTTLNLVGTTNPAWRQRKAESFTFTPIHAGSWRLGYVPARIYGGGRGVTLATAMAVSGAAFNPNMGYQSSPLLSLLMTFFNLRLGYWLPNPKRPTSDRYLSTQNENFFSKSGPSFALIPLMEELLGKTDDTSRWIELTDGGHFENLGLYEMVLRRVKRIIVVDAGADPLFQFEDLGNAVRKIQIDLGVPIDFEGKPDMIARGDLKMLKGMNLNNRYCAVARIGYHCVDTMPVGVSADQFDGYLVYVKASLTGREPVDVIQYAKTHKDFPHETTANQFFSEPQFESYRKLGSFILKTIEDQAERVAKETKSKYYTDCADAVVNDQTKPTEPLTTPYKAFLEGARAQWARNEI